MEIMLKNKLTTLLNIEYPIIQAPMAGGITTANLVAAVSNNGALGMIGAGYLSPVQLRDQIREVTQLTSHNFGVNLFVPTEFEVDEKLVEKAMQQLSPYMEELNCQTIQAPLPDEQKAVESYMEQIQVVIEEKVPICSFTFGVPSDEVMDLLKQNNVLIIGTATTVLEALAIEKLGMDAVVVQGVEAGGHRGNFLSKHEESLIGLMSLIPRAADQVHIPVIAAGGIMDGRGLLASLSLGAEAVQMGTAFLTCKESGAHPIHKEAIVQSKADDTTLTKVFSGKYARGITNKFILEMKEHEKEILDFPIQNSLTQPIRKAAATQNNKDYMSLWAGQSASLAKKETVEALIQRVINEVKDLENKMG